MAIRAILILNGKEYKVDRFGQKFTQNVRHLITYLIVKYNLDIWK